jgi:catechol-2,3-dioxygenase
LISLRRIDHVCLRVADLDEAAPRWAIQFGLTERGRQDGRALLACDYEPYSLELVQAADPGHDHTGFELERECSLEEAGATLDEAGVAYESHGGSLFLADPEGNGIEVMPYRPRDDPLPEHARRSDVLGGFHPRKLGHVNCLTGAIEAGAAFYTEVLGMRLTDWLGDAGVWFHINRDHHVMALVDAGYRHFHHLAFELVDWGDMRTFLDHLAQHGRWLGWGPTRHGVGGNLASYVRLPEEECFVELYTDMELLDRYREPRVWPDNRHSSNTWGPLPPRSYFRFDEAAIESERESLETLGIPLAPQTPAPSAAGDGEPAVPPG